MLPTDYDARKRLPVFTFLTKYFPLAFLEVVRVAVDGDKQHGNTGADIQWAREKSTDQLNTALRHMIDYGTGQTHDIDGRAHLAKAIWRLSAQLQLDEERRIAVDAAIKEVTDSGRTTVIDPCYACDACGQHYPDCPVADSAEPEQTGGPSGKCYYCGGDDREDAPKSCPCPNNHLPAHAADGDTHMPPMTVDGFGEVWPLRAPRAYQPPPRICNDCGVDLDSQVRHAANCLAGC